MTDILPQLIAADMLAVLAAEPSAPHASTQRTVAGATVTLSRSNAASFAVSHRMLTIGSDEPVEMATANALAVALGAPHLDWWATRGGRRLTLDWWEGE